MSALSAALGLALRCCAVLVVLLLASVGVVGAPSSVAVAVCGPRASAGRAPWPLWGLSPGAALRSALALCVVLRGGLRSGALLRLLQPVASPPASGPRAGRSRAAPLGLTYHFFFYSTLLIIATRQSNPRAFKFKMASCSDVAMVMAPADAGARGAPPTADEHASKRPAPSPTPRGRGFCGPIPLGVSLAEHTVEGDRASSRPAPRERARA